MLCGNLCVSFLQYVEALDLCVQHNIPITEEVAERLTIPKGTVYGGPAVGLRPRLGGQLQLKSQPYT